MIIARKGDPVVCSRGHVNGNIEKDIADTDVIYPKDFALEDAATTITATDDGHVCSSCGERITRLRAGTYTIHTAHGWIGQA
jgi:hypothetical protein